jgi:hypothetical protein
LSTKELDITVFPPAFLHLAGASPEIIKSTVEAWRDKKSVADLQTQAHIHALEPALLPLQLCGMLAARDGRGNS